MSDIDCIRMHLEIAEVAKRTRTDMPSIVNFKDALSRLEALRGEVAARDERIAGLEAALRTWNKAFSQIPCWARKWDAFREARSASVGDQQ